MMKHPSVLLCDSFLCFILYQGILVDYKSERVKSKYEIQ